MDDRSQITTILTETIDEARSLNLPVEDYYVPRYKDKIVAYIRRNYPNLLNKECTITDLDINDPESMETFYEMVKTVSSKIENDINMKKALVNSTGRMLEPDRERINDAARNMAFMDGLVKPGSYYRRGPVIETGDGPIYRGPQYIPNVDFGKKKRKYINKNKKKSNKKKKRRV